MINKKWIMTGGLALAAIVALRVQATEPPSVRNVVFILADDLGIRDLGCYGSDYYETPNLDQLAAEGMRFTEAYSAHPVCSPTRASLLTGRYPARLHLTAFIPGEEYPKAKLRPPDWIKYLRNSEVTYAEAFRDTGVATFHVGKWHVDSEYSGDKSPQRQGFETVHAGGSPWQENLKDPHHLKEYTEAIETFMEERAADRFFAVLSMDQVHVPLYEQEELIEKYRKKAPGANGQNNPVYAAMIERMDWSVGRVLAKLKELGLEENMAVVFFSDNGGLSNVYDEKTKKSIIATSNLPYRGGKSQIYEGGIRVPFMIRWPGVTKPGSTCNVPVISTDLYPTFLSLAGLPLRSEQHLDGLSLAPLLRGGTHLNRNCLYWHYPQYQTLPPHGAVRSGDWKLIEHYEDGALELYNLADDPGEKTNRVAIYPERAGQLSQQLHKHLETLGAQMPTPNPDYNPSVFWRTDSTHGKRDPYEAKQDQDPRRYVTDPNLDYGATWTLGTQR